MNSQHYKEVIETLMEIGKKVAKNRIGEKSREKYVEEMGKMIESYFPSFLKNSSVKIMDEWTNQDVTLDYLVKGVAIKILYNDPISGLHNQIMHAVLESTSCECGLLISFAEFEKEPEFETVYL